MTDLPFLCFTQVTHIGTLNARDKGCHGPSHEGHGLSVSQTPAAWTEIGKFGGLPWWTLTSPLGRFLDFHALTAEQRQLALDWAVASKLLVQEQRWEVRYFDEESNDTRYFLVDSEDAAVAECEDAEYVDEAGNPASPVSVQAYVATSELVARIGAPIDVMSAQDLAIVCWCESTTLFEGVWWADDLAPEHLSAPRGVIFPSKVSGWTASPAEPKRFDD